MHPTHSRPKIIAHRGFWKSSGGFENSKRAVQAAVQYQMDGVEVDLRMSKDGVIYLAHDLDIQGFPVHRNVSEDLDRITLPNGESPATYEDFLLRVKDHSIALYIEIKIGPNSAYHQEIVQKTLAGLRKYNLLEQTLILSFSQEILELALEGCNTIQTMFLIENPDIDLTDPQLFKADYLGLDYLLVKDKQEILVDLKHRGYRLNLWTVNELSLAKLFQSLGVDSLTSDVPAELRRNL